MAWHTGLTSALHRQHRLLYAGNFALGRVIVLARFHHPSQIHPSLIQPSQTNSFFAFNVQAIATYRVTLAS